MNFEGQPDRECGEHRTTGSRAWCFECSEWCYPAAGCKGCELAQLRRLVREMLEIAAGGLDVTRVSDWVERAQEIGEW